MKKAFTLVELLIVVIIIGILATIAVPQYKNMVLRAKSAEGWTNLGAIRRSISRYRLETGEAPLNGLSLDFAVLDVGDPNNRVGRKFSYYGRANTVTIGGQQLPGTPDDLRLVAIHPETVPLTGADIENQAEIILYMNEEGTQRIWRFGKSTSGVWYSD